MHMQPEAGDRSDVLTHVGRNLRRLRRELGLSQVDLAERAGMSRRSVVSIEAGEANPGLTSLDHLAAALGTTFVRLVSATEDATESPDVVAWRGAAPDSHAVVHASVPARERAELWTWTLGPGDRYDAQPDAPGWHEMLLVTAGRLRLELADGTLELGSGEHTTFSSAQHYSYVNADAGTTAFTRIVVH
jgi:transcriptional regulator with XRE-family HTH domain